VYIYFTGLCNTLERVSPQIIVLNPPEKLVIETRASGGYQHHDWIRNGNPFGSSGFLVTPQEFPNFVEIFVHEQSITNVALPQMSVGRLQQTLDSSMGSSKTLMICSAV